MYLRRDENALAPCFDVAQRTSAKKLCERNIEKTVKKMRDMGEQALWRHLVQCLHLFLAHPRLKPAVVTRISNFVAFAALRYDQEAEVSLCAKLIEELLPKMRVKDMNVRTRTCMILSAVVSNLPSQDALGFVACCSLPPCILTLL